MGVLGELLNSFTGQGIVGFLFIFIILALGGTGIVLSLKLKKDYIELKNDFENSPIINNETGERNIEDSTLYNISEEFKRSASKGTENINTEVLMAKHLRNRLNVNEKALHLFPASSIALGLLGTFLGLTVSINSTNTVLESGVNSMEIFLSRMEIPLQGMASAFWTSIFGVIMSLILNYIIQLTKKEKENFYDLFEDYLDNILYSEHAFSFVTQFERFNDVIKGSMIDLTKEIRVLFKEGIDELVNNINKNTVDMTESAKVLAIYTKDLELVISSLNNSVDNFKAPIDKFKGSIDDFNITTEKLEFIMNTSINKLSDKMDVLAEVLNKLDMSMDGQKEVIEVVNDEIRSYKEIVSRSYRELSEGIYNISKSIDQNNELSKEHIDELKDVYEGVNETIGDFAANVDSLKEGIGEVVSRIIKEELLNISDEIAEKLQVSIRGIEEATDSLSYNTRTIGELVRATNEWVAVANDD